MKLEIQMLPSVQWGQNLRSNKSEWNRLRKSCYERAGFKCEICESDRRDNEIIEQEREEDSLRTARQVRLRARIFARSALAYR
jgi:hypothetical protein